MDGLLVKNIPKVLLARILVQLYIIPQKVIQSTHFNLLSVLVAGLRDYGQSEDLDGFFSFCARQSFDSLTATGDTSLTPATWRWNDHTLQIASDWDLIDQEQIQGNEIMVKELTGVRLQIASEQVRAQIELVRYGKKLAALHDERLTCTFEGHHVSMEGVLRRALEYMSSHGSSIANVTTLLKERLDQLEHKREEYDKAHALRPETDFVLMGALMAKSNATLTKGAIENDWYLYLRDYMGDDTGSSWRIIKGTKGPDDVEIRISSHQVLADLRGSKVTNERGLDCLPSPASHGFRPVYLFYCNNDIVSQSAQDTIGPKQPSSVQQPSTLASSSKEPSTSASSSNRQPSTQEHVITLADYTFDNDGKQYYDTQLYEMDYELEDEDDAAPCKYCGIPDSIDDVNTIFFCDDCNQGVHQLCEDPNIGSYEMEIDPWYCRDCCRRRGLPIPSPVSFLNSLSSSSAPSGPSKPSPTISSDSTLPKKSTPEDDGQNASNAKKRKLD